MSTAPETLTTMQQKVLDVYRNEHVDGRRSPSLRDVGRLLDRNAVTIWEHVQQLFAKGLLRRVKCGKVHRAVLADVCPLCDRKLDQQ
ncbi:MAG: hypothetical protein IID41_14500 [Planctomycetes bacterium]|nr:hypothetical protein [Planctomycetota bacterium]